MIGTIKIKLKNRYEAELYLVGTYNQIEWDNPKICALGENYSCYMLKDNACEPLGISIAERVNGTYILSLLKTKRYILRIKSSKGYKI